MHIIFSDKIVVKTMLLLFFVGLFLCITGCGIVGYGGRSAEAVKPVFHTVKSGDTLYAIGRTYGVDYKKIALLNAIKDPTSLHLGQRLLVGYSQTRIARSTPNIRSTQIKRGRLEYHDGQLAWPVEGGRIMSHFGHRKRSFHDGIDIAAKPGTPVFAAHGGLVVYSGNGLSGYGNLVILRSKTGLTTIYAHNRRLLVRVGQNVQRKQKIAEVGSTGRSTGPHLHFEVRIKDANNRFAAVDPMSFFKSQASNEVNYRINESLTPILAKHK
jgi:murein DD-endopeptidase MepM/ murein hydrolase activator NlpD